MGRFRTHFDSSGVIIHERLSSLRSLIMFLQPRFYEVLADRDLLSMFYCYRWILVHFKREFNIYEVG